jgi:hypothetical protein
MKELFLDNWQYVAGILMALAGLKVPVVQKLLFAGLKTLISERMVTVFILALLEKLVKSSKTKLDDTWFEEFKKQFENGKLKE